MGRSPASRAAETVSRKLQGDFSSRKKFLLLAETFQALGDTSRIQIVWALSHGELPVGVLATLLEMSQPAVSHHLRTLRNLKLVRFRRVGRESLYSLDDDHIERLLAEGIEHVEDLLN
ncbi:MAG: helix-turn-helix transcriptional regulator [Bdellovibrionales bacterium]|nr:helix-turn-helix transcriptional regulator [Bdellovibrionales bacterium]